MKNRSEASTFAGIPIPLTMETLLDAFHETHDWIRPQKVRQYRAFRERILRMYRERDRQASKSFDLWCTERGIAQDKQRIIEDKDKRIAELEEVKDILVKRIAELETMIDDIASLSHV
jgi:hypothetical protein